MSDISGSSFGGTYHDKIAASVVAIDFLLLPILLSSGKMDFALSNALSAVSISLPASAGYLVMRIAIDSSKQKWEVLYDHLPWCANILRFLFFTVLWLASIISCSFAVCWMVQHASPLAGNLLFLSTGVVVVMISFFNTVLMGILYLKRRKL